MNSRHQKSIFRNVFAVAGLLAAAALLSMYGCGDPGSIPQGAPGKTAALTVNDVCVTGGVCDPSGAHGKHGAFDCRVCHMVGGRVQFAPYTSAKRLGAVAVIVGQPLPFFDAGTKTCSNIACHRVPPGTFTYFFPGGDGEPEEKTVTYGNTAATITPSWYSTGGTCTGCHGNPPLDEVTHLPRSWHQAMHATSIPGNCQLCHPDAVGVNGVGTAIVPDTRNVPANQKAVHGNGKLDVVGQFKSACFGCH